MQRGINVDIEQAQKLAGDWERMGPSSPQMENIPHEIELPRELFSNPKILQAHPEASRIAAQHNRMLTELPDASTQRAVLEAARYFNSRAFQGQRDAILQVAQIARQRLGPEGLAAAERIAARHTAADGSQERAAERIGRGQVTTLLEEASELATSPEVRETIESADPEALVRLDEEARSEVPALQSAAS